MSGRETAAHPGITLVPYFSTMDEGLLPDYARRHPDRAGTTSAQRSPRTTRSKSPIRRQPEAVARRVAAWSNVETAYIEGGRTPPPLESAANPRNANQHYEDVPRTASTFAMPGPRLTEVASFVDMEQGWTLNTKTSSLLASPSSRA